MTDFRDNLRGIAAMLAACLFFILNDTLVKMAGDTLPLGQIIALRGIYSSAVMIALAWATGALSGLHRLLDRTVIVRTLGEVGATFLYLTALLHMPIANSSSIVQAAPLVITAAGAIFLGEHVGWRRWTAVLIGFIGILVIVRPGAEGFNLYALAALGAVFLVALRDLATRMIPVETPTFAIAMVTAVAVMLSGFVISIGETWRPVSGMAAAYLLGSGTFLLAGFLSIIVAMRSGDIAVIAPFRYIFIPYAIIVGWAVWGDVPDTFTFLGIAIVVGTGVYTFYRERRVAVRRGPTGTPTPSGVAPAGNIATPAPSPKRNAT